MCGLAGYSGSTVANVDRLKLLMWDNIDRGRQSCGLYGLGLKTFKAQLNPEEFISQPGFARQAKSNLVIMHNRAPSGGMQVGPDGTHPFMLGTREGGYIIGAHNGTLIEESYEQIKKRNKESGLFEEEEGVDSLSIFRYLLANKFDWSKLNDIYGHMALTWVHDEGLFIYRRPSRPLFFGRESARKLWYSSKEEGLQKIGIADDEIQEVEPFILHEIRGGEIVNKIDLGKPAINLKGGYIAGWRHNAEESKEELNKIFPEKTYTANKHHNNWKPGQRTHNNFSRMGKATSSPSASIGKSFKKPTWMPDHVGKTQVIEGKEAFTVELTSANKDIVSKDLGCPDGLTRMQSKVTLEVRIDQNGKIKRVPNARVLIARHKSFGALYEPDNIKTLSRGRTSRVSSDGDGIFMLPPNYTGEKVIFLIENPNLKGLFYYFETPEVLSGGREFKITAIFPFFQQQDEEFYKVDIEEDQKGYSISLSEATQEINFSKEDNEEGEYEFVVTPKGIKKVLISKKKEDNKEVKREEDLISEDFYMSEEAYLIKQKARWGDSWDDNQKNMLLANKGEIVKAFSRRCGEADEIISANYSKMTKSELMSLLEKSMNYIKEDKERLERDKDMFVRNIIK